MQQSPQGPGWPPQMQQPNGYEQTPTSYGQPPYTPYPPQPGQWQQQSYAPPPPPGFAPQRQFPQQGQWQQPVPPNPQWQQPYGYPQPRPPKKKSHPILIALGVVFVLFLCTGSAVFLRGGSSPDNSTTTNSSSLSNNSSTTATTDTSSSSPNTASNSTTTKVAKVGGTITVDSVGCTLMSAKALAGDEFTQPKPGNEFVVVHVKIHNSNSQQTDYNEFDFHAKSGSGNVTDFEVAPSTYTANNELNSGQLDPGGTVEGDMVFQVPVGDHKAELTWQPNFFGNTTENAWNLGL